jgi:type I restriction enzyme, S subunit
VSGLAFLERLLNGAAVEWVPISKVFHVRTGYTPSKSQKQFWENGTIPWFRMDDIRANGHVLCDSIQKVSENAVKGNNLFPSNSLVFSTSATIGEHALITVPHLANQRFTSLSLKSKYSNLLLAKFLFYYGFILADWCKSNTTKSSFSSVDMDGFRKFLIPIPSPDNPKKSQAIQEEIVRILDAFTELNTELNTELKDRKSQYNHYRERLLNFEDGDVEWKKLGEIASFRRGSFPQPYGNSDWYDGEGSMPFVQIVDVLDAGFSLKDVSKQRISKLAQPMSVFVKKGTVVVTLQGTIGRVAIVQYDCYVDRTLAIFTSYIDGIDKRYFAYQLKRKFDIEKMNARGSTLKTITKEEFSKFTIPIPPLSEQRRIVAILDSFDILTTSRSQGLPREIELRQKQYQYYRDMLLNFPKPPGSA